MQDVPNEPLLSIEEVASHLNVSVARLRMKVHKCEICPAINRRGRMLFWLSAVRRDLKLVTILREEIEKK